MIRTDLIAPISELLSFHATNTPDKMAFEDASRTVTYAQLESLDRLGSAVQSDYPVDHLEILKIHERNAVAGIRRAHSRLGGLFGPQFLDPGDKILHNKKLVCIGITLIHFFHPLLDRHFNAESLVDIEGHVQEIEAVNTEIIDGMGIWSDVRSVD